MSWPRHALVAAAMLAALSAPSGTPARAQTPKPAAGEGAAGGATDLVGTWTLRGPGGQPAAAGQRQLGLMVCDRDGFFGLSVMTADSLAERIRA
jgi:hypothetical protein